MMSLFDSAYQKSVSGIKNVSPPVSQLAEDYLSKNQSVEKAAKAMLDNQVAKCTTSGFISGFGGLITLPVTIPANVGSVMYVQMRMVACTAYMAGYNLNSDQVQSFVYACLAGISVNEIVKNFGVKFGNKIAVKTIEKIPKKAVEAINKKIGFRFLTKFGEKGLINLGKAVPVVGAIINGSLDFAETKIIANRAYKVFIEGDASALDDE